MKYFSSLCVAFFVAIVFLLIDEGLPQGRSVVQASPAKACQLYASAWNVSNQPYGILAVATFHCGTGQSIFCESVTAQLYVTNINTGQQYSTSSQLELRCGNSSNLSVMLQLPAGVYSYIYSCTGDDTGGYYVYNTGLYSHY